MWRLFIALVALAVAIPSSALPQVDFCDEFAGSSINDSIWTIETGDWTVSDGKLIGYWSPSHANCNVGNILLADQLQPGGDFAMDIDGVVLPYGNVANSRYMMLYNSYGNKYKIGFNAEWNEIHIKACVGSNKIMIYAYDSSSGILNASVGDVNHAKLIRVGEEYSFYINGHYIYTFEDEYFNGDVKLGLSNYGTTAFERVCVAAFGQSEPFINECHDLDDNQVPLGWHQVLILDGPGIYDGALRGFTNDGGARLRKPGTVPPGTIGIKFEYDGNIAYSYWGMYNWVEIYLSSGFTFQVRSEMSEVHNGMVTRAKVVRYLGGEVLDTTYYCDFPFSSTDYHYTVTFFDGLIEHKAERLDNGAVLFDLSIEDENLVISAIDTIEFGVRTKTNNNAWTDNLCVEITGGVVEIPLDIKPGSCPNPLNVKAPKTDVWVEADETPMASKSRPDRPQEAKAVLPVAILGTADFDVADIDPASVMLEGVPALRWNIEDVSTPVSEEAEECECNSLGADGYDDLTLKFDRSLIVEALGDVYNGDTIPLTVTGELTDGTPFEGTDCVVILGAGEPVAGAPPSRESPDVVLIGNYPNPFNPVTDISFSLPIASHVKLEIFNVMGQKVATLVDGHLEAGEHIVQWDGSMTASGVYLYRLQADDFVGTKKMILLK
jgi:hypothetical protein